jgi:anti-sigma regulatory factor (Ser/Thr protein kinase)
VPSPARFRHEALFYSGDDDFIARTLPFVRAGVDAEEPVLVAVPHRRANRLKEALNGEREAVCFVDMPAIGRNPARIIPVWKRFVDDHAMSGRPVRGIGEPIWAGRTAPEIDECHRHESLLNLAFDDGPAWTLICPYDTTGLEPEVVEAARASHPHVSESGTSSTSHAYLEPVRAPGPFAGELSAAPADAVEVDFDMQSLGQLRRLACRFAEDAGLGPARTTDFVLAVSELATNSVRHGEGSGTLRTWRSAGSLICEIVDAGHIDQPLAGREHPPYEALGGRGLWLVNQVCDLVQIRSRSGATAVRLHMSLR